MQAYAYLTRLFVLDRHFAVLQKQLMLTPVPEQIRAWQYRLLAVQFLLKRAQKQITFIGVFKAGKSTLLNAMLGKPLLPNRVLHATGVITRINSARDTAAVALLKKADGARYQVPISLDELGKYILLDKFSVQTAKAPQGVEEVRITLPLPLLPSQCMLVDTPGLMDDPALTQQVLHELTRTDLVVMVLSADKLLSQEEKEVIQNVQTLLSGNVIFVINHMDMIEEADKEEVLDWVQDTLRGTGNPFVGSPRVFTTEAKKSLEARINGSTQPDSLREFESWLACTLSGSTIDICVYLSRLSILENVLAQAKESFVAYLNMARSTQQQMWQEDARQHAIRQADWSRKIQASRVALRQCRARLDSAGSTFITNSLNSAQQVISQHKRSAWASEISSLLAQYAQNYIDTLQQEVQKALTGLWIQLAPLGTHVSGADTTVSVSGNPAGKVGAVLGGTVGLIWGPWGAIIGASVGGWLINSMFGTDTKQKTLDAVRQAAQGCLQVLRAEAERYLDDTVQQLEVHDKSHAPVMHPSDKTTTLLQMVEYYEKLVGWCDSFCKDVLTMKKEVQP